MNGDLISREAVLKALRARGRELQNLSVTSFEKAISLAVAHECVGIVKEAFDVDAEPVRHGRWIRQDETFTRYMCSKCKSRNWQGHEKFCPECGAKMDKEAEK